MSKNYLIKILFILYICHFSTFSYGQITQASLNCNSPNVSSLGVYGNVPISLYTGMPQVSIPLYNIEYKGITIPISINHFTGGIHPDQHPGWLGVNWSLQAGGVISRIAKGYGVDEYSNENYPYCKEVGYYYSYSGLNSSDWNTYSFLFNKAHISVLSELKKDTEPDEFSFNFNGYSGKFYLSEKGKWIVQCEKPIKISVNDSLYSIPNKLYLYYNQYGNTKSISGFTITTEDGTQYVFGGSEASIEYSVNFFQQARYEWYAGSWYLTKVIHPNGSIVDLNYERDDFIDQMYTSMFEEYSVFKGKKALVASCSYSDTCTPCLNNSYSCIGYLISPVYLKSISSTDFLISFKNDTTTELRSGWNIYSYNIIINGVDDLPYLSKNGRMDSTVLDALQWRKLNEIQIFDKNNNRLIKSFCFKYNNSPSERLFLDSLVEYNNLKTNELKYAFEYERREFLPPYISKRVDHWGYFNNKPSTYDIDYYDCRNSDSTAQLYGSLKKIYYPTGGYTEFIYEPNKYSKLTKSVRWEGCEDALVKNATGSTPDSIAASIICGGLRIKEIIDNPGNGLVPSSKYYLYSRNYSPTNTDDLSSGVLGGKISYFFTRDINNSDYKYTSTIFSVQSVFPGCINANDSPIGYTNVIEKNPDGSFTKYTYTNFDNGYLDEKFDQTLQPNYIEYQPYNSKKQERGKLISKGLYDSSGIIKQKDSYEYKQSYLFEDTLVNPYFVKGIYTQQTQLCNSDFDFEGTAYKIYTYSMLPTKITSTFYFNNASDSISVTKILDYNSYKQVKDEYTYKNQHETVGTITHYPSDIKNGIYKDMTAKNLIKNPVETISYLYDDSNSSKIITGSKLCIYKYYDNVGNYLPYEYYDVKIDNTLNKSDFVFFDGISKDSHYGDQPTLRINRYNSSGNILETEDKGGLLTTYLWGYNNQYPIAEIKNASYSQVESILGSSLTENLSPSTIDNLRASGSLPNTQITTYTYIPLVGVNSKIDPRGISTKYSYDRFNRLSMVQDNDSNILNKYDYHNAPVYAISATLYIDPTTYYISSTGEATIIANGGSGNFSYSWSLIDTLGNTISQSKTTSNTYSFNRGQVGNYKLQCIVKDESTGNSITVSQSVSYIYLPLNAQSESLDNYVLGSITKAYIYVNGGSGNYIIKWKIKPTGQQGQTSLNEIHFTCTTIGNYSCEYTIEDTITKNIISGGFNFSVVPSSNISN